jgi:hypothetical protein
MERGSSSIRSPARSECAATHAPASSTKSKRLNTTLNQGITKKILLAFAREIY